MRPTIIERLLLLGCLCSAACGNASPDEPQAALSTPIVGGVPAERGQLPFQARITSAGGAQCGGALLDANWVLTAGHCVADIDPSSLQVGLGDYQLSEAEDSEQWRDVQRVVLYPNWGTDQGLVVDDDLALLELGEPVTLNQFVQPIELAGDGVPCAAWASGWGNTRDGGPKADILQRVRLMVAPATVCAEHLASLGEASTNLLCAGAADGSLGACHGDSGGPLILEGSAGPRLLGITIGGGPNCDEYTLFADIRAYRSWIALHLNH